MTHILISTMSFLLFKYTNPIILNLPTRYYTSLVVILLEIYFKKTGKWVIGYNNFFKQAHKIDIDPEYKELIELCYQLRTAQVKDVNENFYFKNISYGNKYVLEEIENK